MFFKENQQHVLVVRCMCSSCSLRTLVTRQHLLHASPCSDDSLGGIPADVLWLVPLFSSRPSLPVYSLASPKSPDSLLGHVSHSGLACVTPESPGSGHQGGGARQRDWCPWCAPRRAEAGHQDAANTVSGAALKKHRGDTLLRHPRA